MSEIERDIPVVDGLPLPRELVALIEAGVWPNYDGLSFEQQDASYWRQHTQPLITKEKVHLFAPDENLIILAAPPFRTLQSRLQGSEARFWKERGALDEVVPELILFIGSFEHGSDSAIALDYGKDKTNPSVIRLKWFSSQERLSDGRFKVETHWVPVAPTFAAFAEMLGLL